MCLIYSEKSTNGSNGSFGAFKGLKENVLNNNLPRLQLPNYNGSGVVALNELIAYLLSWFKKGPGYTKYAKNIFNSPTFF